MSGTDFPRSPVFVHPGLSDMLGLEIWVKDDSKFPVFGGFELRKMCSPLWAMC